jgi:hypothetical protein
MEFKADAERLADAAHPPVFHQQALPLRLGRVTPHQISPPPFGTCFYIPMDFFKVSAAT